MSGTNGNGKWKIAFWIMSILCTLGLGTVGTQVIGNDRIRAREDQRLEVIIAVHQKEINEKLTEILVAIGKLETK